MCEERKKTSFFPPFSVPHSLFVPHLFITSNIHSMLAVCKFLSCQGSLEVLLSIYLSMIHKLVPHMQSHSLFLHHRINKFIVLAFRYMVFSLVLFPSKSCLFKSRTASFITCGVRVLTLCHHGIGGSAPALKSPLMTDKDIIKRTRRKKCRPCSATVQHGAITRGIM